MLKINSTSLSTSATARLSLPQSNLSNNYNDSNKKINSDDDYDEIVGGRNGDEHCTSQIQILDIFLNPNYRPKDSRLQKEFKIN